MAKMKDQRGGAYFFVAVALVLYLLYSLAIAASTAEDCSDRGLGRRWQIVPPAWECTGGARGFG